ncbi:hypothetical protein [Facklamia miroungae]|uniref:Regulator of cell morphogenesis and NO signaling n=1 Tax=Facklamia miroungae TaxID=120956 RepID=A0A1G7PDG8_9LACT|nr:hypothetical protein [Facklamia miroungae]NKZ28673.1 iron-sulfur cluster repair di-iron protein, ric [Facklamia miroungae]SDF84333.1 hypothetical protein SAMN05421791_101215 [Facklamia miroungae]
MKWKAFLLKNEDKLSTYLNAICKVHGSHHPEVYDVRANYEMILDNIDNEEKVGVLLEEMDDLSNHFEVPNDTCETYQAVYQDLARLYGLYQKR